MFLHGKRYELDCQEVLLEGKEVDQEDGSTVYVGPISIEPKIVQLQCLSTLKIYNTRITEIPPELGKLQNLRVLKLCNNRRLCRLSEEIGQLEQLNRLLISDCDVNKIPDLNSLKNLHSLLLPGNKLVLIPESVGCLKRLFELVLANNRIEVLPDSLSSLNKLQYLNLSHNRIREFPKSMAKAMRQLRYLNLGYNELEYMPEEIGELNSLESLSLERNNLLGLPSTVSELQNLRFLNLRENNITSVNISDFGRLTNLTNLNLDGNPLMDPVFGSLKNTGKVKVELNPHGQELLDKITEAYKHIPKYGR